MSTSIVTAEIAAALIIVAPFVSSFHCAVAFLVRMRQCGFTIVARQFGSGGHRVGADRVLVADDFITKTAIGFAALNVFKAKGLKERGRGAFVSDQFFLRKSRRGQAADSKRDNGKAAHTRQLQCERPIDISNT
ncbi:hypothetical protein GGR20_000966 [Devosia subaequoris]|uniref:Uncharacterized protein n=1 Tax=Devosia subaequoris TaxID=395930 RepID=A0A7W6IKI3_9HYPH|nr:hypothetical protein [Devosia subaequoris]MBB4051330.1 hypothetical protein [Devosia subaequoris]MCP1208929.1 hypothetical protein [Devosia subaequoris]